ncbi:MAG: acetyl-CoA carboxylase biotin carboxyl carrier protein subunit [Chitinophagales bacterium]|nr:acetyl-CoA carboxylase biotin carboxyl carrier protein subunit [Bacteroidota bacterium]MCB9043940.1 acetyl-CoA carboxylase biotin carboxyl carrier protein subunit [Chitinophagales bacterium]
MYKVNIGQNTHPITHSLPENWTITQLNAREWQVFVADKVFDVALLSQQDNIYKLYINGKTFEASLQSPLDVLLQQMGLSQMQNNQPKDMKAPMPGLVLDVLVSEGTQVNKGDALLVLEAMKMENTLKSPMAGTVKKIAVKKGQTVEKNQLLISWET